MADRETIAATLAAGLAQARAMMLASRSSENEREKAFAEFVPEILVSNYRKILAELANAPKG